MTVIPEEVKFSSFHTSVHVPVILPDTVNWKIFGPQLFGTASSIG